MANNDHVQVESTPQNEQALAELQMHIRVALYEFGTTIQKWAEEHGEDPRIIPIVQDGLGVTVGLTAGGYVGGPAPSWQLRFKTSVILPETDWMTPVLSNEQLEDLLRCARGYDSE